jgi:hypothetical protein
MPREAPVTRAMREASGSGMRQLRGASSRALGLQGMG